WKVDDTATMLLMRRFYENLLGRFDETRAVAGDDYAPGTPMPKATALREAKRWLRGMTLPERDRTLQAMHLEEDQLASRGRPGTAVSPLGGAKESKPYDHPYYWAAFILVGDPG
ncbi:MAG: CHAT domain-containing protein, partial [Phycisphaerae bacterium]